MNEEKIKFFNEFKDWTKEEILLRAYEICVKSIELTKERDKFRNTLEEIREYIKEHIVATETENVILQIIDKSKINN